MNFETIAAFHSRLGAEPWASDESKSVIYKKDQSPTKHLADENIYTSHTVTSTVNRNQDTQAKDNSTSNPPNDTADQSPTQNGLKPLSKHTKDYYKHYNFEYHRSHMANAFTSQVATSTLSNVSSAHQSSCLAHSAHPIGEQSANLATRQAVAHREPDGELQL
eukprot:gene8381-5869_t